MEQKACNSCIHYRQHYSLDQRKIFRVYCGHCTYAKAKTKRPDSKICVNYMQADPNKPPFVTKEYLSKALLDYVLSLELLPEIRDMDDHTDTSKL